MLKPDPQLDHRRQPAASPDFALGLVDPRQALQQGALAAAVAAGDPEELARLDRERDVPAAPGTCVRRIRRLGWSARSLRVCLRSSGNVKSLADRTRDHHRQPLAADGWSWHGREGTRRGARNTQYRFCSALGPRPARRCPSCDNSSTARRASPSSRLRAGAPAGGVMHQRGGHLRDLLAPARVPVRRLRRQSATTCSPEVLSQHRRTESLPTGQIQYALAGPRREANRYRWRCP